MTEISLGEKRLGTHWCHWCSYYQIMDFLWSVFLSEGRNSKKNKAPIRVGLANTGEKRWSCFTEILWNLWNLVRYLGIIFKSCKEKWNLTTKSKKIWFVFMKKEFILKNCGSVNLLFIAGKNFAILLYNNNLLIVA